MTTSEGIILGIIQGLTEFLPVSSSGHLAIGQKLLGFTSPPVVFDILVHLATSIAVVIYFRHKIAQLTRQDLWFLGVGTIPAVIAGLLLEPHLEAMFNSNGLLAGGFLLNGVMMLTINHLPVRAEPLTTKKALLIGSFQAIAIVPSVSRSGSTLLGAFLSGISPQKAFAFSFLLSIPAILGAATLQFIKSDSLKLSGGEIVGFLVAGISALFAIRVLDTIIKDRKLHYFGYYCLGLALILSLIKI